MKIIFRPLNQDVGYIRKQGQFYFEKSDKNIITLHSSFDQYVDIYSPIHPA